MFLSQRIARAKVSGTVRLSQMARDLSAEGRDIIDLGEGEPDFDTPAFVVEAAYRAMKAGATRYTAVSGTAELKAAVIEKFRRDNALAYGPEQIIVGCGAKQLIFNALLSTLEPGDEVIVPAPHWVSYPDMVTIASGTPIIVPCAAHRDFRLTAEQLAAAITPRSKWLILNSPGNPSGAVYGADHLRALAEVLRAHPHVHVLSDDIYEHIVFDGARFATLAAVAPDLGDRVLTVNGVSKTYAMTGWRIGYAGGDPDLVAAMTKLQGQSTTNPCSISQAAAHAALEGPQGYLDDWRAAYGRRRDLVQARLAPVAGVALRPPLGAFYHFLDCTGLIGRRTPAGRALADDQDVAAYLIDEAGVVLVPGSEFGLAPYLRLCFARAEADLERACARIAEACGRLEPGPD